MTTYDLCWYPTHIKIIGLKKTVILKAPLKTEGLLVWILNGNFQNLVLFY